MPVYQGQATAQDAETAFNVAEAEAVAQARAELGPLYEITDVSQIQSVNEDATVSATVTVTAIQGDETAGVPSGPATGTNPPAAETPSVVAANDAEAQAAASVAAGKKMAQEQSTNQARLNTPSSADWRVRLSLAPNSKYLYNASSDTRELGILAPLRDTDGVLFPYTPQIETSYQAKYQPLDLVHSNYRGYFYQNSYVEPINIKATFTAQDTFEAAYLLAVIHFFRSVTKMFYGQDAQAGTPPPVVFLSGHGQYQFNKHPCLVSNFQYSLPSDVDYIRANGFNNIGVNMENRLNKSSGPGPGGLMDFVINKLGLNGLRPGGVPKVPNPSVLRQNVNNTNPVNSTYVPTKMNISVQLLPIQTRDQVSKQFSVKAFANGSLLQGGFW